MSTFLGLVLAVAGVAAVVTGVSGRGPQLYTAITGLGVPAPAAAGGGKPAASTGGAGNGSTPGQVLNA